MIPLKVFVKKGLDNEIANHNFYAAYDGFKQLGFEICYFQDIRTLSGHQKEDIVISYVEDVRSMLRRHDIVAPEIDYPEELTAFLGRKVWKSRLSVIANHPENWNVFIKPVEDKKFTGIVVRSTKDLVGCGTYGEDPEIWCSDVVKFVAEWRCFVRYGDILDVRRYRGDWRVHFDARIVQGIVDQFQSAPKGYAVDIGLTDQGETLLIEVNDGYALGHYGMSSLDYAKLLSARWAELTNTTDECNF
ncbi:ATP-grasp domain-containing protein [Paenibacillus sp. FSL W8-0426]|uniref:ATP-grasp domain-containing protein n=1 Tax=Paenibacillus sp. FSL W8-0426 TaxID=2921714 RepID=UPI0030DA2735